MPHIWKELQYGVNFKDWKCDACRLVVTLHRYIDPSGPPDADFLHLSYNCEELVARDIHNA